MPTSDAQRLELVSCAIDSIIKGETSSYQMGDGRQATQLDLFKLYEIEDMLKDRIARRRSGGPFAVVEFRRPGR